MTVPFVDMHRLHQPLRAQFLDVFSQVLDSGGYVQGTQVGAFEREFQDTYEVPHALAVANGTAALHLALLACDVGPGDEVITVANTFFATAEAITMTGATPVFIDIEEGGFNMDPSLIEEAITDRTRAVIVVHLYGQLARIEEIKSICDDRGLKLIEDACQAHGAERGGRRAGTFGDAGCLSFYPTKNLGAVGEGGMVLTSDDRIAATVASLRDHGQEGRHNHTRPGFNYRISELQAAALRVALPYLATWNADRIAAAASYRAELEKLESVQPPEESAVGEHVYHLFVVRAKERDQLKAHMEASGVATALHYPTPIHLQPAYAHLEMRKGSLPRTEAAVSEILSLPMHPHIDLAEIITVCDGIRAFESGTSSGTSKVAATL